MFGIFFYSVKHYLNSWLTFILLILVPPVLVFLICVGAGLLSSSAFLSDKIAVGFCDSEKSMFSAMISNLLVTDKKYTDFLSLEELDYQTAIKKVEAGDIDAAIILPDRFVADMTAGINRPIEVICNETNALNATIIKEFMESAAAQISAAQSAINTVWFHTDTEGLNERAQNRIFNSLAMSYMMKALDRDSAISFKSASAFGEFKLEHFFIASALSLFIFILATTCIKPIVQHQSLNIHKRLYASGLSPLKIALQGTLPVAFISFLQSLSIFTIIKILSLTGIARDIIDLSDVTLPAALFVALNTASVCLLFSAIVYLACVLIKNTESAELFAFSFIAVSSVVGGTIIPYAYLPEFFEKFGFLSISRWSQRALLNAAFGDYRGSLISTVVIASISFPLLVISALLIKKSLTGKRAKKSVLTPAILNWEAPK